MGVLCCSKLSESMQKQWQGRKGAERLEKFRAQVLQGCCCVSTSRYRSTLYLGEHVPQQEQWNRAGTRD
jgi:hypothetical protein